MRARNPETGRYMRVADPQPVAEALTASVASLPAVDIDKLPRSAEGWQTRAWRLWRILGVLYFPTSFKAKQVGRLGWRVNVNGEDLEPEAAARAMAAICAPMSVREAARRIALNIEVAGEVWYSRSQDRWNVYAATTPKLKELLAKSDINVRGWTSDPEDPDKPTSTIQAALDTAEAIRLMCGLSRSQDRNRLSQRGIFFYPKEATFPEGDPFKAKLEESMVAPLRNEYDGSAVVPLVVDFPGDLIEKVRHVLLDSPYDEKLMARIEATIRQLALELDMPPEMLLGNMDSNHWNAWLSSEENYRAHVEPLGEATGEVFAKAMMEAVSGAVTIEVAPDPAEMLNKLPSVDDAFRAFEAGIVTRDYVLKVLGADEDDAPTEVDPAIQLGLDLVHGAPSLAQDPGLSALIEDIRAALTGKPAPKRVPAADPIPAIEPGAQAPPEMPANGNGRPVAASANGGPNLETLGRRLADIDIRLLSVLKGLSLMAVEHVREKVTPDAAPSSKEISAEMGRLGDAWGREVTQARKVLEGLGIDSSGQPWDEAQKRSVHLLTDEMTAFVKENLRKTDSEMPALPVLVLRRVLATAGGSGTAVVSAITKNPAPTFADPQGFALGVLPLKDLKGQGVELTQWRFRYGPLHRTAPFEEHKDVDGQFMDSEGYTSEGWAPGDHKGCFAAGTLVEGPGALAATLRDYEGVMVDVTLASGKFITVTPNHPILTPEGWVKAGLLEEGGYVVGRFDPHRASTLIPDDYDAPSRIEDVVGALNEAAGMVSARVPVAPEHFHGDGEGSKVAVVTANRILGDGHNITLPEPAVHQLLGWVQSTRGLTRLSDADPLGLWLGNSPLSVVRGACLLPALVGSHASGSGSLGAGTAARLDALVQQAASDDGTGHSETTTQREFRLSGLVAADQIVKVERRDFSGHVYNLQTRVGWYVAEGVIVHNCECWMDPIFRESLSPDEVADAVEEGV